MSESNGKNDVQMCVCGKPATAARYDIKRTEWFDLDKNGREIEDSKSVEQKLVSCGFACDACDFEKIECE